MKQCDYISREEWKEVSKFGEQANKEFKKRRQAERAEQEREERKKNGLFGLTANAGTSVEIASSRADAIKKQLESKEDVEEMQAGPPEGQVKTVDVPGDDVRSGDQDHGDLNCDEERGSANEDCSDGGVVKMDVQLAGDILKTNHQVEEDGEVLSD